MVMGSDVLALVILYAAVAVTISSLCYLVTVIIKLIRPGVSGYKIFAWTDGLIGTGVTIYAIYDIQTDTGWFAGLFGAALLVVVIPVAVLLLIIDIILYMRAKKRNSA